MANYMGPAGPDLKQIAKDANKSFLEQGSQESVSGLGDQYKRLQGLAGDGGFTGASSASPLASRMAALAAQRQADLEGGFQRELPMQFAARNAGFQGLADKNVQAADMQKRIDDLLAEQRTAKRRAFQKGLGQTAAALAMTAATAGTASPAAYGMMAGGGAGLLYK